MPELRSIRGRGVNGYVVANGELLFTPTAPGGRLAQRFSRRVSEFAAKEAPSNKRPRWLHYGKPLKSTMTTKTRYQPGRMRVISAVGSTAPYALYVDQGTGIYAGKSPWKAKILPPTTVGGGNLYEHTWRSPTGKKPNPVMIKGQEGQFFFDKALRRGFQSMRMRAFQVPGEGALGQFGGLAVAEALFAGNTPWSFAFDSQLKQWRQWRTEAFQRRQASTDPSTRNPNPRVRRREGTKEHNARLNAANIERATKERARRQNQALIDEYNRKELGRKKREEAERKNEAINAQRAENAHNKRTAEEFLRRIRDTGATAKLYTYDLGGGQMAYRVAYRYGEDGVIHKVDWGV